MEEFDGNSCRGQGERILMTLCDTDFIAEGYGGGARTSSAVSQSVGALFVSVIVLLEDWKLRPVCAIGFQISDDRWKSHSRSFVRTGFSFREEIAQQYLRSWAAIS